MRYRPRMEGAERIGPWTQPASMPCCAHLPPGGRAAACWSGCREGCWRRFPVRSRATMPMPGGVAGERRGTGARRRHRLAPTVSKMAPKRMSTAAEESARDVPMACLATAATTVRALSARLDRAWRVEVTSKIVAAMPMGTASASRQRPEDQTSVSRTPFRIHSTVAACARTARSA